MPTSRPSSTTGIAPRQRATRSRAATAAHASGTSAGTAARRISCTRRAPGTTRPSQSRSRVSERSNAVEMQRSRSDTMPTRWPQSTTGRCRKPCRSRRTSAWSSVASRSTATGSGVIRSRKLVQSRAGGVLTWIMVFARNVAALQRTSESTTCVGATALVRRPRRTRARSLHRGERLVLLGTAVRALRAGARADVDRRARLLRVQVPDLGVELVVAEGLVVRALLVVALHAHRHRRQRDDLARGNGRCRIALAGRAEARLHVLLARAVTGLALHALGAVEALLDLVLGHAERGDVAAHAFVGLLRVGDALLGRQLL